MKYALASFLLLVVAVLAWAGFRGTHFKNTPLYIFPDMDFQWRVNAQEGEPFFADGRADRPVVPGTVPYVTVMEHTYTFLKPKDGFFDDTYFATGRIGDSFGMGFPLELTQTDLQRGQQQFNLFCAVCHGKAGDGTGMTVQFGMTAVANLLDPRIVNMSEGEIFNTITHGKNTMGPYGHKIAEGDRWRVIAYLRALQFAANAPAEAVPMSERGRLGL